jgi:hypothetical protein
MSRYGEPISRGFQCPACRDLLRDGQKVSHTKLGAAHRMCYEVTLTIVQTQKQQQGLPIPEHLDLLDVTPLQTYLRMGGAAIQKVQELIE